MLTKTVGSILLSLGAGLTAILASPTPADRQGFLERQQMYLSFEITEVGTREFGAGTPKDAITDLAYRVNRSVRFEVPLNMAVPGSPPLSSQLLGTMEMLEEGRFIGWMAVPPEGDTEAEEQLATGKLNLAKNPMFLPVTFSVDDVHQYRYRDSPSEGWGTNTTTTKGRGVAYIPRSGMLTCDMKKMTCDINNVPMGYNGDADLVTANSTSDVPGFEPKRETMAPDQHLPKPSESLMKQLSGFTITLPDPITVTFKGPPAAPSGGDGEGSTITIKATISSKPAPRAAAAPK